MQRADAKFERKDPWPHVPFAYDDAQTYPAIPEVMGWVLLGGSFIVLCVLILGVA